MATSTNAFFLLRGVGSRVAGTGLVPVADGSMAPEGEPGILWGQGTPAGTLPPWTLLNKASLYAEVNGVDDESHLWQKVDEGNDAADWVKVLTSPYNLANSTAAAEVHAVEINNTVTYSTSGQGVSLNVAQTTAGSGGTWAAAIYAKVTQGATKNVNGYITAAEFELVLSDLTTGNLSDHFVLTLNYNSADTSLANVQDHAYIALRDYSAGDKCRALFWFGDATVGSSATAIVTTATAGYETACNKAVRFLIGTTPYWFLASSTAPAA